MFSPDMTASAASLHSHHSPSPNRCQRATGSSARRLQGGTTVMSENQKTLHSCPLPPSTSLSSSAAPSRRSSPQLPTLLCRYLESTLPSTCSAASECCGRPSLLLLTTHCPSERKSPSNLKPLARSLQPTSSPTKSPAILQSVAHHLDLLPSTAATLGTSENKLDTLPFGTSMQCSPC